MNRGWMSFWLAASLSLGTYAQAVSEFSDDVYPTEKKAVFDQKIKQAFSEKSSIALRDNASQEQQLRRVLKDASKNLFFSNTTPSIGPAQSEVYVVEFFDYQCGYCKRAHQSVNQLIARNKNVRFIFKEFPLFGGASQLMARAALAAHLQNQYHPMHDALMNRSAPVNESALIDIASELGLNTQKFTQDLRNEESIGKELRKNERLGKQFGLEGIPVFIITGWPITAKTKSIFAPGLPSEEELQQMIDDVRRSADDTPRSSHA